MVTGNHIDKIFNSVGMVGDGAMVARILCPRGFLSGGICPWGKCPGGYMSEGLCPVTILYVGPPSLVYCA